MKQTVQFIAGTGLCSGCGVCKGICPKGCISMQKKSGMYLPAVDADSCISCGMCYRVCPGKGMEYPSSDGVTAALGDVMLSANAWCRDFELRHVSASGGIVSTLVQTLLSEGKYDTAFLLGSYSCGEQMKTEAVTVDELPDYNSRYPKSRYLPVSQEAAVEYLRANASERVIFVGVPCAIRGIRAAVEMLKRDKEQYLFIGLFCDQIFNYNVIHYLEDTFGNGKKLDKLNFKNKDSGGWPGNMKLMFTDGTEEFIDKSERVKLKEYFRPERCLYCVDKLNVQADISCGDNYTKTEESVEGTSSVVVRTQTGINAWSFLGDKIDSIPVSIELIAKAQYLQDRLNNLNYAKLKEKELTDTEITLNSGITDLCNESEYEYAKLCAIKKMSTGMYYDTAPDKLRKAMSGKKGIESIKDKYAYAIKRQILRALPRLRGKKQ